MAHIIGTNGMSLDIKTENGKLTLDEMQKAVGGYIELVNLPDGKLMVVNEEGLIHQLPLNQVASDMARRLIVGNVVIANADEID